MKLNLFFTALIPFLLSNQAKPQEKSFWINQLAIAPFAGYSTSDLRFSIAGNEEGTSPNVLSELKWKSVKGPVLGANGQMTAFKNIKAGIAYQHQFTHNGIVTDMDFAEDNRKGVFSDLVNSSHKGFMSKLDLQLGLQIFKKTNFSVAAYLGYALHKQKVYLLNFEGASYENDPGYSEGLESDYQTNWKNYGIVLDIKKGLLGKLDLQFISGNYFAVYSAAANWNLIKEFQHPVSFEHTGQGFSSSNTIQLNYQLIDNLSLSVGYNYGYNGIRNGKDKLYYTDGSQQNTRLNEVVSSSHFPFFGLSANILATKNKHY